MIALLSLFAAAATADLPPIDVPYQAMPAFMTYTQCVLDAVAADARSRSADPAQVRQANGKALDGCRSVRERELQRALKLQTDARHYGSRAAVEAAVRTAFDRFDSDYRVEPIVSSGTIR